MNMNLNINMTKKKARIIFAVVVLAIFSYLLFIWTMAAIVRSKNEVIVPDIKGKSVYEALSLVSEQNMGLKKHGEEFDDSLPAGVVIKQSPPSGLKVKEGKIVKVVISQGGESVFVPDLIEQEGRASSILIRSSGLILGEENSKYSVVYKKGTIISQDPPPGTIVDRDSMVNILVSAGKPPSNIKLMPKWVGKNIAQVSVWADDNNFELLVKKENISDAVMGEVLSQDPEPDSNLKNRKIIKVIISGIEEDVNTGQKI
ncbi:PASTA domain-containing protein [Elusimicrobiota bacterium]